MNSRLFPQCTIEHEYELTDRTDKCERLQNNLQTLFQYSMLRVSVSYNHHTNNKGGSDYTCEYLAIYLADSYGYHSILEEEVFPFFKSIQLTHQLGEINKIKDETNSTGGRFEYDYESTDIKTSRANAGYMRMIKFKTEKVFDLFADAVETNLKLRNSKAPR